MKTSISPLIEVADLLSIYKDPDVLLFDVRSGKEALKNYELEHLEGAVFVDLDSQLARVETDFSKGGRHPLPNLEDFAETLCRLGISSDRRLILYDDKSGSNAAARFWWMLRSAGLERVQVLNGGLAQAKKNHFPLRSQIPNHKRSTLPFQLTAWNLPSIEMEVVEHCSKKADCLIIDVRDKERYEGKFEPIDLIAGHIPGAINVPFTENLDAEGLFLKPAELREKYAAHLGSISAENTIVHCGSGVTACHSILAFDYAGMPMPKLYVGSWSEWSRNNKDIERSTT